MGDERQRQIQMYEVLMYDGGVYRVNELYELVGTSEGSSSRRPDPGPDTGDDGHTGGGAPGHRG